MGKPDVRSELIRAVRGGESVAIVAARLGVPVSTAYQWKRSAVAKALPPATPAFVEVIAERGTRSAMLIRIGVAEIEVRAGFDAQLLREVVDALGGES